MRVLEILNSSNELILCSEYTNMLIFYNYLDQTVTKEYELRERPQCISLHEEDIYVGQGSGIEVIGKGDNLKTKY